MHSLIDPEGAKLLHGEEHTSDSGLSPDFKKELDERLATIRVRKLEKQRIQELENKIALCFKVAQGDIRDIAKELKESALNAIKSDDFDKEKVEENLNHRKKMSWR